MKYLFFQKIWPWLQHPEPSKKSKRGAMTLVSIFLFVIFSTLGLGMLCISQLYLKMSAFKKNSIILDYASENGIKLGLNQLINSFSSLTSPSIITEERVVELRNDALNNGTKIIEELLHEDIPLTRTETQDNLSWTSITTFVLHKLQDHEDYFRVCYSSLIDSEGEIENFKQFRYSSLETALEVSVGNIPLSALPLLVDKDLTQNQKNHFLTQNNIELSSTRKSPVPASASFSQGELLPQDAIPQINEALNIKIFRPQDLTTAQLRDALGLEPSNDPVPEGVYLIQDDLGLSGIFVEGDLLEMVLAIAHESQVIAFKMNAGHWTLWFNPSDETTRFYTPGGTQNFDRVPRGIIIIDGAIQSLGGGIVSATGEVTLVKDQEIPCILRGVNLTIISSDKITISSHLIHQGVDWQEGVPYIKDSNSQLNIFALGQDLQGNGESTGQIVLDANAPEDMKIQASLTASGKGIALEGAGQRVHLLGSLQTKEYVSNGNTLKITFDERIARNEQSVQAGPKTALPILYLSSFNILEWREYE